VGARARRGTSGIDISYDTNVFTGSAPCSSKRRRKHDILDSIASHPPVFEPEYCTLSIVIAFLASKFPIVLEMIVLLLVYSSERNLVRAPWSGFPTVDFHSDGSVLGCCVRFVQ